MKTFSTKTSEVILLIVLYIAGLVFFRMLMILGTVSPSQSESLSGSAANTAIALVGIVTGIGMAFIEFKVLPRIANLPNHQFFIARFIITTTTVIVSIALVYLMFTMMYFGKSFSISYDETLAFVKTGVFWSCFIYLMLFSMVLSVFKVVHYHIGPGTFINFVTGKYRIPQEEDRLFMFIDLKSSTSIAEQLGHSKYSRFLNTCFNDLTEVITLYQAEIYQFVGDEAVLTWKTNSCKNDSKCIRLFYDYKKRLAKNRELYLEKFGVFPEFKVAIHAGLVSASETQGRRRELVYHGDVLNTCARILELCSRLKKEVLLSEHVVQWINSSEYTVLHLEEITLRGKGESTSVYEVLPDGEIKHADSLL